MGVPVISHRERGKKLGALFKAQQHPVSEARVQFVGLPGNRIRLVDERRDPAKPSGENRRGRSEPAHAEDRIRLELPIDLPARRQALVEPLEEAEDGR